MIEPIRILQLALASRREDLFHLFFFFLRGTGREDFSLRYMKIRIFFYKRLFQF